MADRFIEVEVIREQVGLIIIKVDDADPRWEAMLTPGMAVKLKTTAADGTFVERTHTRPGPLAHEIKRAVLNDAWDDAIIDFGGSHDADYRIDGYDERTAEYVADYSVWVLTPDGLRPSEGGAA